MSLCSRCYFCHWLFYSYQWSFSITFNRLMALELQLAQYFRYKTVFFVANLSEHRFSRLLSQGPPITWQNGIFRDSEIPFWISKLFWVSSGKMMIMFFSFHGYLVCKHLSVPVSGIIKVREFGQQMQQDRAELNFWMPLTATRFRFVQERLLRNIALCISWYESSLIFGKVSGILLKDHRIT